ncbi:MAG TPA: DNA-directed RNA polymerase subunit delta [Bacillus bacterium]|nr:DNA-directed RNA polymerase subunit delta [Bacillus sp. (in: firmicutes)]
MISKLTIEEIQELSMIEIAMMLLQEEKQAVDFYDLFNKVADLKGLSQEEKDNRIAQFYTDMNVDGRFLCIGENRWGLRTWYPYDQVDEEVTVPAKTRKKKGKKKIVEDEFDDYDEDEDYEDEDSEEDYLEEDEDLLDDEGDEEEEEDLDFDDLDEDEDEEDEDLLEEDEFELDEDFEDPELEDELEEDEDEDFDKEEED